MSAITYFVALPIVMREDGDLMLGEPVEAQTAPAARSRASMLATKYAGAIAFSRTGDASTGDFEPAEIITTFGVIPTDLAEVMGLGG